MSAATAAAAATAVAEAAAAVAQGNVALQRAHSLLHLAGTTAVDLHAAFAEFERAQNIFLSIAAGPADVGGSSGDAGRGANESLAAAAAAASARSITDHLADITRRFRDNPFLALQVAPTDKKEQVKKAYHVLARR
jgi:hypothetical protein